MKSILPAHQEIVKLLHSINTWIFNPSLINFAQPFIANARKFGQLPAWKFALPNKF